MTLTDPTFVRTVDIYTRHCTVAAVCNAMKVPTLHCVALQQTLQVIPTHNYQDDDIRRTLLVSSAFLFSEALC